MHRLANNLKQPDHELRAAGAGKYVVMMVDEGENKKK